MAVSASDRSSESGGDSGDSGRQGGPDLATSSTAEHGAHCANDANRDDDVLERHHALLVGAETLHGFGGLDVIAQHRESLSLKMDCRTPLANFSGCERQAPPLENSSLNIIFSQYLMRCRFKFSISSTNQIRPKINKFVFLQ
ncbi:hypothetical protein [Bradyrhizobium sp. LMG 9283]|uniref:hypothetical protein n=1 Tax=Bradyrhizobium sp. LMG 9283 TaxID=592064 RepID=UPI00389102B3